MMLFLAVVYQNFETSTAVQDSSTAIFTSIATTELELSTSADASTTETRSSRSPPPSELPLSSSSPSPSSSSHSSSSTGPTSSPSKSLSSSPYSSPSPGQSSPSQSLSSSPYSSSSSSPLQHLLGYRGSTTLFASATVSTSVSTSSRHTAVGNHGYFSTGTTATATLSKHKATTASLRFTQTPKTTTPASASSYPKTKCCCSCCSEDYATDAESCRSCTRESLQTAVSCASKSAPSTTKVPAGKENFVAPKPVEGSRYPERLTLREEFRRQEQLTEVLAAMPAAEKAALGYSIEDLIVDCHYDGLPCDMDRSGCACKFFLSSTLNLFSCELCLCCIVNMVRNYNSRFRLSRNFWEALSI